MTNLTDQQNTDAAATVAGKSGRYFDCTLMVRVVGLDAGREELICETGDGVRSGALRLDPFISRSVEWKDAPGFVGKVFLAREAWLHDSGCWLCTKFDEVQP